jgi:hypothetical protein
MVDYFALAVSHGLLALAAWRLMFRGDLDRDPPGETSDEGAVGKTATVRRA